MKLYKFHIFLISVLCLKRTTRFDGYKVVELEPSLKLSKFLDDFNVDVWSKGVKFTAFVSPNQLETLKANGRLLSKLIEKPTL